jgi:hypothetical protein
MRYDVTTHPLLSPDAKGLGNESLRQHNELAEELLGLLDVTEVTDPTQLARVKRAIVLQINWQVLLDPDARILKSKTVGAESETYRDDLGIVDSTAVGLLEPLLPAEEVKASGTWEPIRSKRG